MATISVTDFPAVTTLEDTDILYLIRGTGADRDKTIAGSVLKGYIGETLLKLTATSAVDLSNYTGNLVIQCAFAVSGSLTITNELPDGYKLVIWNTAATTVNTTVAGDNFTLTQGLFAEYIAIDTGMEKLYNSLDYYTASQIDSGVGYPIGYIETNPYVSGTDLIVEKPTMRIDDSVIIQTSNTTIDLTGLTASTWYALVCREDTGIVSANTISSFSSSGTGNWDTTGLASNQLDMYTSLWDSDRKYCRAYDGTNYYRVFGVFKTNATPDNVDYLFYTPNLPKSKIYLQRLTDFSTALGYIPFDTILYDINSEWDTVNYYVVRKLNSSTSVTIKPGNLTATVTSPRVLQVKNNTEIKIESRDASSGSAYWGDTQAAIFETLTNDVITTALTGTSGTMIGSISLIMIISEV